MKWFNNLKVAWKVMIASSIFIILILVISMQGITALRSSKGSFDAFYADRFVPVIQLDKIARNMLQIRINMLQEQLGAESGDWTEVNQRFESSEKLSEEYQQVWQTYMATKLTEKEEKLAETFASILDKDLSIRNNFRRAIENRELEQSTVYLAEWRVEYAKLRDTLNQLIELQQNVGTQLMMDQEKTFNLTMLVIYIILGAALLVAVIVTFVLSNAIRKPVNKGLSFAQTLADGNFTERIDLDQKDELGMLGSALNKAADDIEKAMTDIMVGSQNLVQAIQEISSGNENLSQRTSEQASSLEEIASTIEENTATINKNADNSIEANKLARNASGLAEEGGKVMGEAVSSINEINESSKKIEEIISVINDISFQTNLLVSIPALN